MQTIENQLPFLSQDEQLRLIKSLVQNLRKPVGTADFRGEMAAMAADPEIQAEIRQIEMEFSSTDADGLEGM
ncbi:MAG: hypothetical protein HYX68_04930 [Planctomycetes bacterium]|nr:hypothetical protein [Planctomycetota bacterium]